MSIKAIGFILKCLCRSICTFQATDIYYSQACIVERRCRNVKKISVISNIIWVHFVFDISHRTNTSNSIIHLNCELHTVDHLCHFKILVSRLNDVDDFLKWANENRCVMQHRCNVDYDGSRPTALISLLDYDECYTNQKQSLNACRHKQYTPTRHMTYCYRK